MKEDMNKPWFGKRKLGWGWGLPLRWEGWATLVVYLVTIWLFYSLELPQLLLGFLVILTTAILLAVAWKTSGKPEWGTWWKA